MPITLEELKQVKKELDEFCSSNSSKIKATAKDKFFEIIKNETKENNRYFIADVTEATEVRYAPEVLDLIQTLSQFKESIQHKAIIDIKYQPFIDDAYNLCCTIKKSVGDLQNIELTPNDIQKIKENLKIFCSTVSTLISKLEKEGLSKANTVDSTQAVGHIQELSSIFTLQEFIHPSPVENQQKNPDNDTSFSFSSISSNVLNASDQAKIDGIRKKLSTILRSPLYLDICRRFHNLSRLASINSGNQSYILNDFIELEKEIDEEQKTPGLNTIKKTITQLITILESQFNYLLSANNQCLLLAHDLKDKVDAYKKHFEELQQENKLSTLLEAKLTLTQLQELQKNASDTTDLVNIHKQTYISAIEKLDKTISTYQKSITPEEATHKKFIAIQEIRDTLQDTNICPLTRLATFKTSLNTNKDTLQAHRDSREIVQKIRNILRTIFSLNSKIEAVTNFFRPASEKLGITLERNLPTTVGLSITHSG